MYVPITGMGVICAAGTSRSELKFALRAGRSGIRSRKYIRTPLSDLPLGEVPMSNAEMATALGLPTDRCISRTVLMGLSALRDAMNAADLLSRKKEKQSLRIWLINGTTVGGMDLTEQYFLERGGQVPEQVLSQHDCGSSTERMAAFFPGLFDKCITLSTACSSAANAIALGGRLIEAGMADIVVAGGSEALTRFHLGGFHSLMVTDSERCRPFDATRQGLNLGEGAAYLVLERPTSRAQAWLTGWGNCCDAFHQTATSPDGDGPLRAMQEALQEAGLQPSDIDYVNAHGTGTLNNDSSEARALQRLFGEKMPPVSSTKAFTGHTTSAAGAIEAVISLLAMEGQFLPANLGWQSPMPEGLRPTMGAEGVALRHVMSNSFGFGGNDTCLIFSAPTPIPLSQGKRETNGATAALPIVELSRVELSDMEALKGISAYVRPLEARRMGKLMKGAYLSAMQALEAAGVKTPDAIITATAYGLLAGSERLLRQLAEEGEQGMSPTLFMQSTHNTLGSDIAIRLGCHGYNCTYVQGARSLECALLDAKLLIAEGKAKNVLVGCHDEGSACGGTTGPAGAPLAPTETEFHSLSIVLSCGE